MRVLLLEDDEKIASFIVKGFRQAGMTVDHSPDGEEGLSLFLTHAYDASVVDIMLPGIDGLTIIETVRNKGITTPVLILSARRSLNDRVKGLQRGGDDYLVKPFAFSELLVRVQALVRRSRGGTESSILEVGDLTMDLVKREVFRDSVRLDLPPREFALLELLMRHPGQPLSKTLIMEKIWDFSFDPQTNVVDVLVCRLRGRIDKGFSRKSIRTIRGVGYVLESD